MTDPAITTVRMRPARGVIFREEDKGFFLYDAGQDVLYQGNETGKQILVLCDGFHTVAEVIGLISPDEHISGYVIDFLSELRDKGLMEEVHEIP